MLDYEIKITGSGTTSEIIQSLREIIDNLANSTDAVLDGAEWEDATLMTEIKAK